MYQIADKTVKFKDFHQRKLRIISIIQM